MSVAGRAGRFGKSDARARRHQSTVPVAPSTTMLTYRLTGTTEASGSTATNPTSLTRWTPRHHSRTRRHRNLRTPWCAGGAALLTCGDIGGAEGTRTPDPLVANSGHGGRPAFSEHGYGRSKGTRALGKSAALLYQTAVPLIERPEILHWISHGAVLDGARSCMESCG